jgi:hypothetical protein
MRINWMEVRLKLKILFRLNCRVFATYYVIEEWEDVLRAIDELHISSGEIIDDGSMQGDDVQHDGFFPDEGQVIIQSMGDHGNGRNRWKITFEVDSMGLEKLNYWLGPIPIKCQSFDKTFKHFHNGESVEWGIR